MSNPRRKILFICVHNRARSQMAEGLCKSLLGDQYEAYSAGSEPADQVHPLAVSCLEEVGIDISQQKPQHIDEFSLEEFSLVIPLCAEEQCPVLPPSVKIESWALPDPSTSDGDQLSQFRITREEIKGRLLALGKNQ